MGRKIVAILKSVLIITQSSKLKRSHINARALKASKFLRIFSKLRHFMPLFSLNLIFKAIVLPQMTYGCEIWGYTYQIYLKKLEILQNRMVRVLTFSIPRDSSVPIFAKLKWFKLIDVITINSTKFIFKAVNGMSCEVTNGLFSFLPKRRTRSDNEFYLRVENWKIQYLRNSLFYKGIELWNQSPTNLRLINSFKIFKNGIM